jgi:hypothetical protein
MFGISERHRNNDFVFISKTKRTIGLTQKSYYRYELYLYTINAPAQGKDVEIHEVIMRWEPESRRIWPEIVRARINEYTDQCQSRYTSIYTPGMPSSPMISLSYAYNNTNPKQPITGMIKDSYNHIIAIAYRLGPDRYVALPVVDDGAISIILSFSIDHTYLHWDDFPSAPLEDVLEYYKSVIVPTFVLFPGYKVMNLVRKRRTENIIAIQLENGIFVPVAPPQNRAAIAQLGLPIIEIEEFQWNIDKQMDGIVASSQKKWSDMLDDMTTEKRCGVDKEVLSHSSYKEFEEVYQQFRYMVSNYIAQTPRISAEIERIIFTNDLPFFEKRKRLDIYLGTILSSWFYSDATWESSVSFLRKDCRVITTEQGCTGHCTWRSTGEQKDEESGTCLLHVKDQMSLDGSADRMVTTSELFTKRVIDELVYFPARRNQLMKKDVSSVSKIMKPDRKGDQ